MHSYDLAIEAALDLGNHLIARNNWRVPEDYADTFRVMGENGLLSKEFAEHLTHMARFRNRLVHRYWDVDPEQLYYILTNSLGDLDRFLAEVRSNLTSQP